MVEKDGKVLQIMATPQGRMSPALERFRAEHRGALVIRRFNPRDPRSKPPTPVDKMNKK
jgi:hypothetical protein